jgi:thiosulfate/3-mercaptopyruvate sulfurtransferase
LKPEYTPTTFISKFNPDSVVNYESLVKNISLIELNHLDDFSYNKKYTVLDARSADRFSGYSPEPRPGLKSGHGTTKNSNPVPSSINIPFGELLNKDGTFLSKAELVQIFTEKRVDINSPLVTMCGSGVTACIVNVALDVVGIKDARLYDGSWTDYASRKDSAIRSYE